VNCVGILQFSLWCLAVGLRGLIRKKELQCKGKLGVYMTVYRCRGRFWKAVVTESARTFGRHLVSVLCGSF
jgi:hypothetical protein